MQCYIKAIKNYVNFSGRASRKEYWTFMIFNLVISFVLTFVDGMLGLRIGENGSTGILSGIYSLFVCLPSLALLFRRIHDINKPATWIFISLIPVIGWIWIIIYTLQDGTAGTNKYGTAPRAM